MDTVSSTLQMESGMSSSQSICRQNANMNGVQLSGNKKKKVFLKKILTPRDPNLRILYPWDQKWYKISHNLLREYILYIFPDNV